MSLATAITESAPAPRINPAASPESVNVWKDIVSPKYDRFESVMVAACQAQSDAVWPELPEVFDSLAVDVGCGFGEATRALAQRYPAARVVGIDCAEVLIERARGRHAWLGNLDFVLGDVGEYVPDAKVQLLFSRFGLMFFERPVQTLRHLHGWMQPGGVLRAWTWQPKVKNPWLTSATEILLRHVPPVDEGAPSCGPGPFSMSDRDTTRAILEAAYFTDVRFHSVERRVFVGEDARRAADVQLALGPAGEIMRHAVEAGHPGVERARAEVEEALEAHATPRGVFLPSASWAIEARA
jgi:ubiquinone/menaquinone biosynthesis C-methylase UbiE